LNNTTLAATTETASRFTERSFVLEGSDMRSAPAGRLYFLVLGSSNSADRLDEAGLLLEVEEM
jgi:hypothetical protein